MREDCKPGDDIRPVVGLDDHVVEFEITPNRPDCLSVIGLAREVSATFDKPCLFHQPEVKGGAEGVLPELLDVETPDPDLCPRYTARMVRNVKIAPSPSGCGSVFVPTGSGPSITLSISPTMSCWNTASPCTPLTTGM